MTQLGRELELVAQLRELLLPNRSSGAWPSSSVKVEGGGLPDTTTTRRRRLHGSKRFRNNKDEQVEESNNRNCSKRRYVLDLLTMAAKTYCICCRLTRIAPTRKTLQEAAAAGHISCDIGARFRWVPVEEVRPEANRGRHVPKVHTRR
jgi:hypothetical protein